MTPEPSDRRQSLLDMADLCVKCGLCLPHCPTYLETQHEGDSPRGRIAMMQGHATGALHASARLEAHLDGCLGCRACESVCPAKVPYGALIDHGRTLLGEQRPQRLRGPRVIGALLSSPIMLRLFAAALWLYRKTRLQSLIRRTRLLGSSRLARLESLLPSEPASRSPRPNIPAERVSGQREHLSLFSGCMGRLVDQESLAAVRLLFSRMGYAIDSPPTQTCCGALRQHNGLPEAARDNVARNVAAFAASDRVIHCASGCGATLTEYAQLNGDASTRVFVDKLEDVMSALLKRWPANLQLRPLKARVALHLPCTQRNVLGGVDHIRELLNRIPELELVELDGAQRCCGAAGTYFVTQPEMADALLAPKLDAADRLQPDYIVSTNIGCSLHLAGGLRRRSRSSTPEVLHPATLLARQLA